MTRADVKSAQLGEQIQTALQAAGERPLADLLP